MSTRDSSPVFFRDDHMLVQSPPVTSGATTSFEHVLAQSPPVASGATTSLVSSPRVSNNETSHDTELYVPDFSTAVHTVTATTTRVHATAHQNISTPVPPQVYSTAATAAVQAGQTVPSLPSLSQSPGLDPRVSTAAPYTVTAGMRLRSGHTLPPFPISGTGNLVSCPPVQSSSSPQVVQTPVSLPSFPAVPTYQLWSGPLPYTTAQPCLATTSASFDPVFENLGRLGREDPDPRLTGYIPPETRGRAPSRASSRVSMSSTQFRAVLQDQRQQMLQEQKQMMQRLLKDTAREAATRASRETAKAYLRQQEESSKARQHHEISTAPSPPAPHRASSRP